MNVLMKLLHSFATRNKNMKSIKNKKSGMAIVIVLCFSAIILVLGTVYVKSYTATSPVSKLQLDRIQADFLAKGIQNIALFKIKKYPDFFVRSYRYYASNAPGSNVPYNNFLGNSGGILQNQYTSDFIEPISVATYSTGIRLINSKDFQSEAMEIVVNVKLKDKGAVNTYKTVIQGLVSLNENTQNGKK